MATAPTPCVWHQQILGMTIVLLQFFIFCNEKCHLGNSFQTFFHFEIFGIKITSVGVIAGAASVCFLGQEAHKNGH
jgi:hypothetical protein